jgi:hypothetical protein
VLVLVLVLMCCSVCVGCCVFWCACERLWLPGHNIFPILARLLVTFDVLFVGVVGVVCVSGSVTPSPH